MLFLFQPKGGRYICRISSCSFSVRNELHLIGGGNRMRTFLLQNSSNKFRVFRLGYAQIKAISIVMSNVILGCLRILEQSLFSGGKKIHDMQTKHQKMDYGVEFIIQSTNRVNERSISETSPTPNSSKSFSAFRLAERVCWSDPPDPLATACYSSLFLTKKNSNGRQNCA